LRRYTIYYYQITLHRSSAPILTYHYDKPLKIGQQIEVPVHSKVKLAMVLDEVERPEGFETSEILNILENYYSAQQIAIAKFISEYYFSSLGEAIALFMPYRNPRSHALRGNADESLDDNRLLEKLGDDGFSLVLFGTKVADSKKFCKKSNTLVKKMF